MSSDFFDSTVAPVALVGGLAFTARGVMNDIYNGKVKTGWEIRSAQKKAAESLAAAMGTGGRLSDTGVPLRSDNINELVDMAVEHITRTYGTPPGDVIPALREYFGGRTTKIKGIDPRYRSIAERMAIQHGLYDDDFKRSEAIFGNADNDIVGAFDNNKDTWITLKDKINESGTRFSNEYRTKSRSIELRDVGGIDDFRSKLTQHGADDDLVAAMSRLYDRVRSTDNVSLKLKMLHGVNQEASLIGISIQGIHGGKGIDLPIADVNGIMRFGPSGDTKYVARRVMHKNVHDFINHGNDVGFHGTRRLDAAIADDVTNRFGEIIGPNGRSLYKSRIRALQQRSVRDSASKAMVLAPSEDLLIQKIADQVVVRDVDLTSVPVLDETAIKGYKERRLTEGNFDPSHGVGPSQQAEGVMQTSTTYGGKVVNGAADNKSMAQSVRDTRIESSRKHNFIFDDVTPGMVTNTDQTFKTAFIPRDALESVQKQNFQVFNKINGLELHEDISILADTHMEVGRGGNIKIGTSEYLSKYMQDLMANPEFGATMGRTIRVPKGTILSMSGGRVNRLASDFEVAGFSIEPDGIALRGNFKERVGQGSKFWGGAVGKSTVGAVDGRGATAIGRAYAMAKEFEKGRHYDQWSKGTKRSFPFIAASLAQAKSSDLTAAVKSQWKELSGQTWNEHQVLSFMERTSISQIRPLSMKKVTGEGLDDLVHSTRTLAVERAAVERAAEDGARVHGFNKTLAKLLRDKGHRGAYNHLIRLADNATGQTKDAHIANAELLRGAYEERFGPLNPTPENLVVSQSRKAEVLAAVRERMASNRSGSDDWNARQDRKIEGFIESLERERAGLEAEIRAPDLDDIQKEKDRLIAEINKTPEDRIRELNQLVEAKHAKLRQLHPRPSRVVQSREELHGAYVAAGEAYDQAALRVAGNQDASKKRALNDALKRAQSTVDRAAINLAYTVTDAEYGEWGNVDIVRERLGIQKKHAGSRFTREVERYVYGLDLRADAIEKGNIRNGSVRQRMVGGLKPLSRRVRGTNQARINNYNERYARPSEGLSNSQITTRKHFVSRFGIGQSRDQLVTSSKLVEDGVIKAGRRGMYSQLVEASGQGISVEDLDNRILAAERHATEQRILLDSNRLYERALGKKLRGSAKRLWGGKPSTEESISKVLMDSIGEDELERAQRRLALEYVPVEEMNAAEIKAELLRVREERPGLYALSEEAHEGLSYLRGLRENNSGEITRAQLDQALDAGYVDGTSRASPSRVRRQFALRDFNATRKEAQAKLAALEVEERSVISKVEESNAVAHQRIAQIDQQLAGTAPIVRDGKTAMELIQEGLGNKKDSSMYAIDQGENFDPNSPSVQFRKKNDLHKYLTPDQKRQLINEKADNKILAREERKAAEMDARDLEKIELDVGEIHVAAPTGENAVVQFMDQVESDALEGRLDLSSVDIPEALADHVKQLQLDDQEKSLAEIVLEIANQRHEGSYTKAARLMQGAIATMRSDGIHLVNFSSGGFQKGSGNSSSVSASMRRHAKAQGGAAWDAILDAIKYIDPIEKGDKVFAAKTFMAWNTGKVKAHIIDGPVFGQYVADTDAMDGLLHHDPAARKEAFGKLASHLGVENLDEGIAIRLSEDRLMYMGAEPGGLTGGFATATGGVAGKEIDTATREVVKAYMSGGDSEINNAVRGYTDTLTGVLAKKGSPLEASLEGKVRGSSWALARANPTDLERYIPGAGESFGIEENHFSKKLREMGAGPDEVDAALAELRQGQLGGIGGRDPMTGIDRVQPVSYYSIDEYLRRKAERFIPSPSFRTDGMVDKRVIEGYLGNMIQNAEDSGVKGLTETQITGVWDELYEMNPDTTNGFEGEGVQKVFSKLRDSLVGKLKNRIAAGVTAEKDYVTIPEHIRSSFGADFDGDHIINIFSRDRELRARLNQEAKTLYALNAQANRLMQSNPGISQADLFSEMQGYIEKNSLSGTGVDRFWGNTINDTLYGSLKAGRASEMIDTAKITPGTEAFNERRRVGHIVAELEKKTIGSLSNAVDATRESMRLIGHSGSGLLAAERESLLGFLPELSIKGRQIAEKDPSKVRLVQESLERVGGILKFDPRIVGGKTNREVTGMLSSSIRTFFQDQLEAGGRAGEQVERFLSEEVLSGIIEGAAYSRKNPSIAASLALKAGNELSLDRLKEIVMNPGSADPHARAIAELAGVNDKLSIGDHIKNGKTTVESIGALIWKHKKGALVGGAGAVVTAMLLGTPKHISEDEAIAAGARHQSASEGKIAYGRVPLSTGSGRSIRIKGYSENEYDQGEIHDVIASRFSNASVSVNVSDYRERINQEFLRRGLSG